MAERPLPDRGMIDTSVVIGLDAVNPDTLPAELAIASITLAELAAGPHATDDRVERARRQQRLQLAEATFDPIPFDSDCARAYGRVYAQTLAGGRNAGGARAVDLLIAATALAADLALCTANPTDFAGLETLIDVIVITASHPSPVQRATVADAPDAGRYVIELDGARVGHLDYRLAGGEMTMVHAEVDPAHGRQGLGSALVRGALGDARARGLRVRPLCPFVVDFIARHPGEYDDLVA